MTEQATAAGLHLIFSRRGLNNCINALGAEAATAPLLLLQDAVYAATDANLDLEHCLVLAEDLALRGIGDLVQPGFRTIDRGTFVELTARHSPVVSWS